MKKVAMVLLLITLLIPVSLIQAAPSQQGIVVPSAGQRAPGVQPLGDSTNPPPFPSESEPFTALNDDKLTLAYELVNSLSKQQKALIGELMVKNRSETLEAATAEMARALESGDSLTVDASALDSLRAELERWQRDMEAGLATILSPEQYALYLDSLLPPPSSLPQNEIDTRNDCYYAYYYGYYGNYYAYYFYLYAYYTYQSADDPYTHLVLSLAYNDYLQSLYGYTYAYYAYNNYYNQTYAYYTYYYTRHAEGTSLYGTYMAYVLYTWTTSNPYSYNTYLYGAYSYNYITIADNYAYACYATLGGQAAPKEEPVTLAKVGGLESEAALPKIDPTAPPLPEGVSRDDLAMALDGQKVQATISWVRSLTPEQREKVRAAVFAQKLPYLPGQNARPEDIEAVLASLVNWQNTISARLSKILSPEQYQQYLASLLPPPNVEVLKGIEAQSDCYSAYYYNYYGVVYGYQYYLYAYYTYTTYQQSDPYVLDNYLFGYYSYLDSYYGYLYSYYAYVYYYNQTYGYYAYYYTRHAEGFSYYGLNFAYMTYTWLPYTDPYNTYIYAYYTYYYIHIGDDYAWNCYTPPGWVTIIYENFEGTFPGSWSVFDNYSGYGEYYWAKRSCRPYQGSYSGWAVGGGANGSYLSCGSNYPNNAESWMVYGPFSLSGASDADLTFKLWLNAETNYDFICRLASINGTNFYGTCTTGNTGGWVARELDLTNVPTLGNLLGRSQVWIALVFDTDSSVTYSEGAYVDNVLLRKCIGTCTGGGPVPPSEPQGLQEWTTSFYLPVSKE